MTNNDKNKCLRTLSFRIENDENEDSWEHNEHKNHVITSHNALNRNLGPAPRVKINNIFGWSDEQKAEFYHNLYKQDSHSHFGTDPAAEIHGVGNVRYPITSNYHLELKQNGRKPMVKIETDESERLSFGEPCRKLYESNTNANTNATEMMKEELRMVAQTAPVQDEAESESISSIEDIEIELESGEDVD
jgi:hypothetical protein